MRVRNTTIVVALVALGSVLAVPPSGGFGLQLPSTATGKIESSLLDATSAAEVFVHGRTVGDATDAIADVGLVALDRFEEVGAVFVTASPSQLRALATDDRVTYVEPNGRLQYYLDTSHKATRGVEVALRDVRDPSGLPVDGNDVGVAVIDSGVDGTHPDFEGVLEENYSFAVPVLGGPVEVANGDQLGGHGTHVAGTVAGNGSASDGRFTGAAPGVRLYGLGAGAGLHVYNAAAALRWVRQNHAAKDIRVVNNSWGGAGEHNPNSVIAQLVDLIVADGVVVVFAAGNDGGDGSAYDTNLYANNPTAGVISVANYDDQDQGKRNGTLSSSSSRGLAEDETSWPDISAPGSSIMAPCRLTLAVCNAHLDPARGPYLNHYAGLSGTSMAAPHVAGYVALLLQANPSLTPAQVEDALEDTAFKFPAGASYAPDPLNPGSYSSYDKGHGLVDVVEAIREVCGTCSGL